MSFCIYQINENFEVFHWNFLSSTNTEMGGVKSPITPFQKEIELSHAISNGMHFPTKITFSNKYVAQVHIPTTTHF